MDEETTDKAELLTQLDFEIASFSDANKRSGLTQWTLWAALAGSLWLLTHELDGSPQLSAKSLVAFLLFVVASRVYQDVKQMLAPAQMSQGDRGRFRSATTLRWGRFMYLVFTCRELLIAIASAYVANSFSFWTLWILALSSMAYCLASAGVLTISYVVFHFPEYSRPLNRVVNIFGVVQPFILLLAVSQPLVTMIHGSLVLPMSAWRIGGLLFVISFLLERTATEETTISWIHGALLDLRRDLTLYHVSPDHVKQQFSQMLKGMTVSEVFRPDLERILKLSEDVVGGFQLLKKAYDEIGKASADQRPAMEGRITSDLSTAQSAMDELVSLVSRFVQRIKVLELFSSDCSPEAEELIKRVMAEAERAKRESELARSQIGERSDPI